MKKLLLLISLAVPFAFNGKAQTTLTLQPDSTTGINAFLSNWPDDNSANTNFYPEPDVDAIAWTEGDPYIVRSLLNFDLSSIPAGAIITSATLTLYNNPNSAETGGQHSHLSGSNAAWLQRVTSPWKPFTVTWNTQPSTTTVDEAALPEDTNPNENYIINVTSLTQDMVDSSSSSFGFMLLLQTEQYYRSLVFASCYNADSTLHPKLVITYTTGCTSLVLQPDSATGNSASISSFYPDSPFLYGNELDALAWTIGGGTTVMRGLVSFDLSSIPTGAVIQSASLTLYNDSNSSVGDYGQQISLTSSNAAWLQRITSAWNQNTVTWNNQPTTTTTDELSLAASTSFHENYIMDVTTLVQDMINNPSTSFGFMIRLQLEQYYAALNFGTSNNPDNTIHPKLEICYTAAAAPPPVASFQSSDSILCTNDCVVFTNQSANATSLQWLFPGATPDTSTAANPSICYFSPGNYNVTLIASNATGSDTLKFNNYITVSPIPSTPVITQSHDTLLCNSNSPYGSFQWYYYNTPIPNATDTFIVVSFDGNYNIKVTNKNGCSIAVGINVILGINELEANSYFDLYPNPAANQLTIHTSSFHNEPVTVSVVNILGQVCSQSEIVNRNSDISVDVSKLSAGMYFVEMKTESVTVVKRFVKD